MYSSESYMLCIRRTAYDYISSVCYLCADNLKDKYIVFQLLYKVLQHQVIRTSVNMEDKDEPAIVENEDFVAVPSPLLGYYLLYYILFTLFS